VLVVRQSYRLASFACLLLFGSQLFAAVRHDSDSPADPAAATRPDLLLQGEVRGAQNHTYVQVPFQVPPGLQRVTITFAYTEKEQHTALDLGLLDPVQLRCWSGGNKSTLTVGLMDATPSCLPGPVPSGAWKVLIGVPNIRAAVVSHYTIQVFFTRSGLVSADPDVLRAPLKAGPGWYRGDLHMHTAHSDGQCPSQSGHMVPCPVFFTVDAAARRGLDFIAITDHNATSHYDAMRELQPWFDKLLLIPGREITTFQGHLNLLGTTQFLDFRLGSSGVPDMNSLLREAQKLGALISINHPAAPSGEACMGCGFTPAAPVDMRLFSAIEAVNGGSENPAFSGIPFWEHQLDLGFRLTAIGGSDNHRPMAPLDHTGSIGWPTTVVYATDLSTPAILAGIRSGRVFIDLTGTRDRLIDLSARAGDSSAAMGGELAAASGSAVSIEARVAACPGAAVHLVVDGVESAGPPQSVDQADQALRFSWPSDGGRHWLLVEVRDSANRLLLLSNPVYINWKAPAGSAHSAR
jgi:hypothetical protein